LNYKSLTICNRITNLSTLALDLSQPSNSTPDSDGTGSAQTVSTSGNNLFTALATPDSSICSLHRVLSAKGATVSGMLRNFDFAEELTEGSTVTGSVFSGDSDFARTIFSHFE